MFSLDVPVLTKFIVSEWSYFFILVNPNTKFVIIYQQPFNLCTQIFQISIFTILFRRLLKNKRALQKYKKHV